MKEQRMYSPDKWVVLYYPEHEDYAILGGFYGGYLHGDSWRRSTSIQRVEETDDGYMFYNKSGSVYKCHKNSYGFTGLSGAVHSQIADRVPALTEDEAIKFIDILQKEQSDED